MKIKLFACCLGLFFLFFSPNALPTEQEGRLGVGTSNQLITNMPGLSVKLQKSSSFAFGAVFAIDSDEMSGGYGAGVKLYKLLFDEPQLNFYSSLLAALINQKYTKIIDKSGFQFDLTLGSEFHFSGLQSLGFSFEFGVSFNKIEDFKIQTVGHNFFSAGIHFYL